MEERPRKGSTVSLPVAGNLPHDRGSKPFRAWPHIRSILLRLYRLGIIVAIVWLIHYHAAWVKVQGESPIIVDEVRPLLPAAAKLEVDPSEKQGLFVLDKEGNRAGYVLKTSPISDSVRGYSGPTDTLIVLDNNMKVAGLRIRSSTDTKEHVRNVATDEYFMKTWNEKTWEEVAGMDPKTAGIEGVSGASLTSLSIANAIQYRFKKSLPATRPAAAAHSLAWMRWIGMPEEVRSDLSSMRIRADDWGLLAVIAAAGVFSFTHLRSITWARRAFQIVLIGYVGFYNGQLLAQSMGAGWAANGVPWQVAPGLTLLAAAALAIPWSTRRALYCSQICPHGAAQELLGRIKKKKLKLHHGLEAGLKWLPPGLIALVLAVTIWKLPLELAGIEPFDAYLIKAAGIATIAVAIIGLAASIFVPMAYCKYGCPTGLVLNFMRAHGKADHFGRRDIGAALLLLLAYGIYLAHADVTAWILAGKPGLW